jgi:hypothetical protein
MILILARAQDALAGQLAQLLEQAGRPYQLVHDLHKLKMTVCAERDTSSSVRFSLNATEKHFTAIMPRLYPTLIDSQTFLGSERLAAWSALALFQGTVINRPSRLGFIPSVDAHFLPPRATLAVTPPMPPPGCLINAQEASTGRFLRREEVTSTQLTRFTVFDPIHTARLLIVGEHVFDVRKGVKLEATEIKAFNLPWHFTFQKHEVPFMLVTLECFATPRLLEVNYFPVPSQYESVATRVHQILVSELT